MATASSTSASGITGNRARHMSACRAWRRDAAARSGFALACDVVGIHRPNASNSTSSTAIARAARPARSTIPIAFDMRRERSNPDLCHSNRRPSPIAVTRNRGCSGAGAVGSPGGLGGAELGGRLAIGDVLEQHRPPRSARLELAEDRADAPHDPIEDHETRRHVEVLDDPCVWALDVEDHAERVAHPLSAERELVGEVRHVGAAHVVEHVLRVETVSAAQEAGRLHRRDQLIGIAVDDDRLERRAQRFPLPRCPALHEAVVEERDAAVVVELVVAGVWIAVEHPAPQHGVLGEPPEDLGGALLGGVRPRRPELLERHAVDPFGGQQALRRQLRDEAGHAHPRVTGVQLGELDDVARLELVVELLAHARPQLVDERLGVEPLEHHRREHRVHHLGGVEVGLDRGADARVLHLHGDIEAARRDRAVDLPDARRRDREVGPVEEDPLRRVPELGRDDARRQRRCHRGGIGLQRGEGGLGLLRQGLEDEADQLAGLHQHALHLAELLGDVLGGADRELLVELRPALGRGAHAARLADGEAGRVARRQLPHPGGAAEAAGEGRPRCRVSCLGDCRQPSGQGDDRRHRARIGAFSLTSSPTHHRRLQIVTGRDGRWGRVRGRRRGSDGRRSRRSSRCRRRDVPTRSRPRAGRPRPRQGRCSSSLLVELLERCRIGGGGGDVHARRRYRAAPPTIRVGGARALCHVSGISMSCRHLMFVG